MLRAFAAIGITSTVLVLLGAVGVGNPQESLVSSQIDTSAELRTILTDETGTGAACFATTPTFTTSIIVNGPVVHTASTIAADDATPSVAGAQYFVTSANTGATAITDLDDPVVGATYVLCGGSNTNSSTIADSGNFNLNSAITLSVDVCVVLKVQADNDYVELGRNSISLGGTATANIDMSTFIISFGTDPADAGDIRLENNTGFCTEADPAGTDVCWAVNAAEYLENTGGAGIDLNGGDLIGDTDGNTLIDMAGDEMQLEAGGTMVVSVTPTQFQVTQTAVLEGGYVPQTQEDVTGNETLGTNDCGRATFVTAGIDGNTITLPALGASFRSCELTIVYTGASGGALVDISPNSADSIRGTCEGVVFSGTDDADIGLVKATSIRNDYIRLMASDTDWAVVGCEGIWANN